MPYRTQPLSGLQVVGIRYAGSRYVGQEQRALNAYLRSGVYAQAGVPFDYAEPHMPDGMEDSDQAGNSARSGERSPTSWPRRAARARRC